MFDLLLASSQQIQTSSSARWEDHPLTTASVVLLLLGLLCDAYVLYHFVFSKKAPTRDSHFLKVESKPWGVPELLLIAAAILCVFFLSTTFYSLLLLVTKRTEQQIMPMVVTTELFLRVGILVAFAEVLRRRGLRVTSAFGLSSVPPVRAVGWGIVFGLASMPPVQLLILTSEKVLRLLRFKSPEQPIAELLASTDSHLLLLLLVVFAVVVAPVFEECFFRGVAYPALKQRFGLWPAMLMVSAVFALSHAHLPSFVPLFALAIGLGFAYEVTGSLLASISMHALFNSVMIVNLFIVRAKP